VLLGTQPLLILFRQRCDETSIGGKVAAHVDSLGDER
jgi:hypothetical protein